MVEITGRVALTRDGVISTTPNGTAVANCGAADNVLINKGEKVAVFYELVAWEEIAEQLATFKKGEIVEITGRLLPKPWKDKSGQQRINLQVTLNSIKKYVKSDSATSTSASTSTSKTTSASPATKAAKSTTKSAATPASATAPAPAQEFVQIPDDDDTLPF